MSGGRNCGISPDAGPVRFHEGSHVNAGSCFSVTTSYYRRATEKRRWYRDTTRTLQTRSMNPTSGSRETWSCLHSSLSLQSRLWVGYSSRVNRLFGPRVSACRAIHSGPSCSRRIISPDGKPMKNSKNDKRIVRKGSLGAALDNMGFKPAPRRKLPQGIDQPALRRPCLRRDNRS